MSGADVGGDRSVEWRVFVENVRRSTLRSCTIGDHGFEQGGVDETDPGEKFSIGVKIPRESEEFVRTLRAAADEAARYAGTPGYVVHFALPIERENPDQIQIRWKSSPVPTGKRKVASAVAGARTKAVPRKPAATVAASTAKAGAKKKKR